MPAKIVGFNLIELMITLTIIGILSAISLPTYLQHIIHARRLQAETALLTLASALEKYYSIHQTYDGATLANLKISELIANNQYQLHISDTTTTDFSIKATPLGNQAEKDSQCGTLVINADGTQKITGTGSILECWPT